MPSLDAPISGLNTPIRRGASWLWFCSKQAVGIANAFEDIRAAMNLAKSETSASEMEPQLTKLMKSVASTSGLANSVLPKELLPNPNEVPWMTIAFYVTLGKLLERDTPYGVVITSVVPGPDGDRAFVIA